MTDGDETGPAPRLVEHTRRSADLSQRARLGKHQRSMRRGIALIAPTRRLRGIDTRTRWSTSGRTGWKRPRSRRRVADAMRPLPSLPDARAVVPHPFRTSVASPATTSRPHCPASTPASACSRRRRAVLPYATYGRGAGAERGRKAAGRTGRPACLGNHGMICRGRSLRLGGGAGAPVEIMCRQTSWRGSWASPRD